ncbi:hypothetical protein FA09DRAFT_69111 [Tilletiopsis washingtonensis]|uniref:Uncharacterized protein n=1 Tax=Tilletiopsis washingtonensis TaxID=58919 RepID=A0A316Z9A9_9BASI|nr:hypothetical protein FA09DRAFT_69111 [Tilletiopsis washingtonensis]PWN96835.1 hypothetical protein FA09DRAFT_69111 [Tilletiopsis washingtonensis]
MGSAETPACPMSSTRSASGRRALPLCFALVAALVVDVVVVTVVPASPSSSPRGPSDDAKSGA